MKATAALKAADRNPYSWNMAFYEYPDGRVAQRRHPEHFLCGVHYRTGHRRGLPHL